MATAEAVLALESVPVEKKVKKKRKRSKIEQQLPLPVDGVSLNSNLGTQNENFTSEIQSNQIEDNAGNQTLGESGMDASVQQGEIQSNLIEDNAGNQAAEASEMVEGAVLVESSPIQAGVIEQNVESGGPKDGKKRKSKRKKGITEGDISGSSHGELSLKSSPVIVENKAVEENVMLDSVQEGTSLVESSPTIGVVIDQDVQNLTGKIPSKQIVDNAGNQAMEEGEMVASVQTGEIQSNHIEDHARSQAVEASVPENAVLVESSPIQGGVIDHNVETKDGKKRKSKRKKGITEGDMSGSSHGELLLKSSPMIGGNKAVEETVMLDSVQEGAPLVESSPIIGVVIDQDVQNFTSEIPSNQIENSARNQALNASEIAASVQVGAVLVESLPIQGGVIDQNVESGGPKDGKKRKSKRIKGMTDGDISGSSHGELSLKSSPVTGESKAVEESVMINSVQEGAPPVESSTVRVVIDQDVKNFTSKIPRNQIEDNAGNQAMEASEMVGSVQEGVVLVESSPIPGGVIDLNVNDGKKRKSKRKKGITEGDISGSSHGELSLKSSPVSAGNKAVEESMMLDSVQEGAPLVESSPTVGVVIDQDVQNFTSKIPCNQIEDNVGIQAMEASEIVASVQVGAVLVESSPIQSGVIDHNVENGGPKDGKKRKSKRKKGITEGDISGSSHGELSLKSSPVIGENKAAEESVMIDSVQEGAPPVASSPILGVVIDQDVQIDKPKDGKKRKSKKRKGVGESDMGGSLPDGLSAVNNSYHQVGTEMLTSDEAVVASDMLGVSNAMDANGRQDDNVAAGTENVKGQNQQPNSKIDKELINTENINGQNQQSSSKSDKEPINLDSLKEDEGCANNVGNLLDVATDQDMQNPGSHCPSKKKKRKKNKSENSDLAALTERISLQNQIAEVSDGDNVLSTKENMSVVAESIQIRMETDNPSNEKLEANSVIVEHVIPASEVAVSDNTQNLVTCEKKKKKKKKKKNKSANSDLAVVSEAVGLPNQIATGSDGNNVLSTEDNMLIVAESIHMETDNPPNGKLEAKSEEFVEHVIPASEVAVSNGTQNLVTSEKKKKKKKKKSADSDLAARSVGASLPNQIAKGSDGDNVLSTKENMSVVAESIHMETDNPSNEKLEANSEEFVEHVIPVSEVAVSDNTQNHVTCEKKKKKKKKNKSANTDLAAPSGVGLPSHIAKGSDGDNLLSTKENISVVAESIHIETDNPSNGKLEANSGEFVEHVISASEVAVSDSTQNHVTCEKKKKKKKKTKSSSVSQTELKVEDEATNIVTESSSLNDQHLTEVREGNCHMQERIHFESPRRKLIILDVNGLLADIVATPLPSGYIPDLRVARKAVFRRPFCESFLQFCFERFDVGVWSSRVKYNLNMVLEFLLGELKNKLIFYWDRAHCTTTKFSTVENKNKPLVMKELKNIWEYQAPSWKKGKYDESNTLLVDDSPYKALRNPAYTAIFPLPYQYTDVNDCSLGPGGDLRVYLEKLAMADNVPEFVKNNRFGQRPITETNLSWKYYKKVLDAHPLPANEAQSSDRQPLHMQQKA